MRTRFWTAILLLIAIISLWQIAALPLAAYKPGRPPDTTITRRPPHCNPGLPYNCTPTPSRTPRPSVTPATTSRPTLTPYPTFDPGLHCAAVPAVPCWWQRTETAVALTATAYSP